MTRRSWVQDPVTHKLIPKGEYVDPRDRKNSPYVQGDIDPFVSPVTKEIITSRSKLRDHLKEHGISDSRDYSKEYIQKRRIERENEMTGNTREAKNERIDLISRELHKRGV